MLLINPCARRGDRALSAWSRLLAARLALAAAIAPTSVEALRDHIRQGLSNGIQRFVIGGGDGTLSAAADVLANTSGILGVIPLGTGNTFWHALGYPHQDSLLADLFARGPVHALDVGEAQHDTRTKIFVNSLTVGVSERLIALLTRDLKRRWGYAAWICELEHALANTPPLHIRLTLPVGQDAFVTRQLVVASGRTIAAGIAPTPTSSNQDGLLEVFRLGGSDWSSMLVTAMRLVSGRLITTKTAHYHKTPSVAVHAVPAVPTNVDGEQWALTPVSCRSLAGALRVIAQVGPALARRALTFSRPAHTWNTRVPWHTP
jgi:diacylglycerol kinase family enzyme